MKKLLLVVLALLFFSFSFAHDENVSHYTDMSNQEGLVNPDGYFEYMIVKGDYLWLLADKFYGDPFKWTKIHKANPYVIDPDWIFPNNWLVIPNVYADKLGNPMIAGDKPKVKPISGVAMDLDGDGIVDGVDLDGDGVIDADAGIDLDGDGVIDGYDLDGDGNIDIQSSAALAASHGIDVDGDGVIDGVDIDGDGVIDANAEIDVDGDGIVDGYDVDGDGNIDVISSAALAASHGIDVDGDGTIDGVDLDGDGVIDANAEIDVDSDGVVDGYDIDGDGNIDVKAGAAAAIVGAAAVTEATTIEDDKKHKCGDDCDCKHSYCGKPGWKLGLHAGYPIGSAPEDESLNLGLLLGTPLGVKVGPLHVGLGAGVFTYNMEDLYIGGGVLASLCINDLLKLDMPLKLQLHGAGFYIFGEESGPGFGGIGSASVPIGNTPLSLGLYGGAGKYYPGDNDYNWANVGAVLYYNF